MNKLSVIIPIFERAEEIRSIFSELDRKILSRREAEIEIIFVDDGSTDASYEELLRLRDRDRRIRLIRFPRHCGIHAASHAGLTLARGSCIAFIPDLQQAPLLLWEMYDRWKRDSRLVLVLPEHEERGSLGKRLDESACKILRRYALPEIPRIPKGDFDCFLVDSDLRREILARNDARTPIVGQALYLGYKPEILTPGSKKYELKDKLHEPKKTKKEQNKLLMKLRFFADHFLPFSYLPIRFLSTFGVLTAAAGFCFAFILLLLLLFFGYTAGGFTLLMIFVLVFSGLQITMLGIFGEYLWRILDETRKVPPYLITESEGFDEEKESLPQ